MTSDRTQFDYLLNAFERASQSDDPSDDEYASKRRALHAYVRDLEARATPPTPAQPPVAVVTECEACFTPDVCQLRGKCDHYSTDWLRVAPPALHEAAERVAARLEYASGKDAADDFVMMGPMLLMRTMRDAAAALRAALDAARRDGGDTLRWPHDSEGTPT